MIGAVKAAIADRRASHRRSLSNLETIVGFAAIIRARADGSALPHLRSVRASISCASSALMLEHLGAAPYGGVGRIVANAQDRQRREIGR